MGQYLPSTNVATGPAVIQIFHDREQNIFFDESGREMVHILQAITPNDLYLYHHDPGRTIFHHREDFDILVEIVDLDPWYEEGPPWAWTLGRTL